jgi:hypothetical protein
MDPVTLRARVRSVGGCLSAVICVLFVGHAAFAPLYENGLRTYTSPVGFLAFASVFASYAFRARWGDRMVWWAAGWWVFLTTVFPPEPKYYGRYLLAARVLLCSEVLLCIGLLILLLLNIMLKRRADREAHS